MSYERNILITGVAGFKVVIKTVDRLLGNTEGTSDHLITYVTNRAGHDLRYAIDATKINNVKSGDYLQYYKQMYGNR